VCVAWVVFSDVVRGYGLTQFLVNHIRLRTFDVVILVEWTSIWLPLYDCVWYGGDHDQEGRKRTKDKELSHLLGHSSGRNKE